MVGFRKARAAVIAEPSFHGWPEKPLEWLFGRIAGDHPNIQIGVTGFEQIISLNGNKYSAELAMRRTDLQFYKEHALAFNEIPRPEGDITFVGSESKLVGTTPYTNLRGI